MELWFCLARLVGLSLADTYRSRATRAPLQGLGHFRIARRRFIVMSISSCLGIAVFR